MKWCRILSFNSCVNHTAGRLMRLAGNCHQATASLPHSQAVVALQHNLAARPPTRPCALKVPCAGLNAGPKSSAAMQLGVVANC